MSKNKFFAGFILGAIAAGAAGLLIQQNKGTIKGKLWQLKMRAHIDRKLRALKKFSRAAYDEIVDEAIEAYRERGVISEAILDAVEAELKRHWKEAKTRFEEATAEAAEEADEEEDEDEK